MKIIRFEIQVEELDNVVREIEIKPSQTFKELSLAIFDAFGIKPTRGASFYTSNNKWQKLNEITLGKDSKFEKPINGLKTPVEKALKDTSRFIFFSEDVPQFTFLLAAAEEESKAHPKKFPRVAKSVGALPAAKAKKFTDHLFSDDFTSRTGDVYDASEGDLHPED